LPCCSLFITNTPQGGTKKSTPQVSDRLRGGIELNDRKSGVRHQAEAFNKFKHRHIVDIEVSLYSLISEDKKFSYNDEIGQVSVDSQRVVSG